ncbi:sensor histidine kinase [Actinoplanes teichomyceticus]|uniref:sensor histidine kinase n=1 Tax=Actinoplanes teichomyceticus TaxID=1867 RepID=UPI001A59E14C|nr:sensor histidine kinase [Actinoplanes teichomyceticus]GIF16985.1 two-component sensor histidine kinase [Actinoplanes teichomyceticus]
MDAAQLIRRLRPTELYLLDTVAAVAVSFVCLLAALAAPVDGRPAEPGWLSLIAALVIALPIAARRRWPYPVAITVTVATALALAIEVIPSFAAPGPACALALAFYTFGAAARDRRAFAVEAACSFLIGLGMVVPMLLAGHSDPAPDSPSAILAVLFGGLVIGPSAILGFAIGERRAQNAQRSEQLRREATIQERLRLARELHDIIAHTMTLIVVKASVGNHVAEADPAEARDALRVIEKTGRAAMLEVRKMLDTLREETSFAPTPGLDDLPELVELASLGDARVTLTVERPEGAAAAEMPDSVQLAVYRIVQEAVTNVVKHAAPAHCQVTVMVGCSDVRVEVTDDGKREPTMNRTGHGLIGMRERVALHGGTFDAGPRAGGGFSVTALLPLGGPAVGNDSASAPRPTAGDAFASAARSTPGKGSASARRAAAGDGG